MGECHPLQSAVDREHGGADILSGTKTFGRMGDPADRDVFDPDKRDHTAPDVDKCAERLHMRHTGGDDIAGRKGREQGVERLALCVSTGQDTLGSVDREHPEADRLADPGENRDFAGFSGVDSERAFLTRDDTGVCAECDVEIVVGVTAHSGGLQNTAVRGGRQKLFAGRRGAGAPLGRIVLFQQHKLCPPFCSFGSVISMDNAGQEICFMVCTAEENLSDPDGFF